MTMTVNREDPLVRTGRAWVFGDNVPNDGGVSTIEMTRNSVYDPAILARSCMCGVNPDFPRKAGRGDFVIAGANFGRGQLHVQGPLGLIGLDLGLIAESVSRSFFRISIAVGLKMLPFSAGIRQHVSQGDELTVDFRTGTIDNLTTGQRLQVEPLPDFLVDIISVGGEKSWLKTQAPQ